MNQILNNIKVINLNRILKLIKQQILINALKFVFYIYLVNIVSKDINDKDFITNEKKIEINNFITEIEAKIYNIKNEEKVD